KGGCIETKTQTVDFSRCVSCFNCLQVCPFSSAEYSINELYTSLKPASLETAEGSQGSATGNAKIHSTHKTDTSKRKFLAGIALAFMSLTKLSKAQELVSYSATNPVNRMNPISPPGAKNTDRFNESCTACHLCVNACPTGVLQPALFEYGLRGLMQPRMDNHAGFCNYDCVACTEVCPTGALLPLKLENKQLTQLGVVQFVKENCIVETERTNCGSCSEHCPTKAVYMIDYKEGLLLPETNTDICIGCGACEYACPTMPYKAIYVDGNPEHLKAEKPDQEKVEVEDEEDFPF
ncbi:MAG: 4Fe-4S dicluster domain-containing protein, partial [Bacteroidota bacterium]